MPVAIATENRDITVSPAPVTSKTSSVLDLIWSVLLFWIIDKPFAPLVNRTFSDHLLLIIILPHFSAKLLLVGLIFVALNASFELGVIKKTPLYFSKLFPLGLTKIFLFFF